MQQESQSGQVTGDDSPQGGTGQRSQVASAGEEQIHAAAESTDTRRPRNETERLRQEAESARQEAARYRTQLRTLEQQGMDQHQLLQRSHEDLTQTHTTLASQYSDAQTTIRSLRAELALSRNGALHPDLLASRLSDDDLASDDAVKAAVKSLKRDYPELFQRTTGSADGGREGQSIERGSTMNDMIRARMTGQPS